MRESQNSKLEVQKDQIRIALSLAIIGFFWALFKIFFKIQTPKKESYLTINMFIYFISWMLQFLFIMIGSMIVIILTLYIICLSSKYTYAKKQFISDKFIYDLYDTGVILFWSGLLISAFLASEMACSFIIRQYPFISDIKKNLIILMPFFIIFTITFIRKIIRKLIKLFRNYNTQMSQLQTRNCSQPNQESGLQMSKFLNPDDLKIGYIILINTHKFGIEKLQYKAGYGDNSKWTHVAGSLGGYTAIEANIPRSRLINLQKEYVDRGCEIKVMKRRNQEAGKRYKIALWWATMNNLPYDVLQFFWFPLSLICGKIGVVVHNLFSSRKRFLCSEFIATGFYKEGDYLFGKSAENILPADFDDLLLFEEVNNIWLDNSEQKT